MKGTSRPPPSKCCIVLTSCILSTNLYILIFLEYVKYHIAMTVCVYGINFDSTHRLVFIVFMNLFWRNLTAEDPLTFSSTEMKWTLRTPVFFPNLYYKTLIYCFISTKIGINIFTANKFVIEVSKQKFFRFSVLVRSSANLEFWFIQYLIRMYLI